jgi:hypothetical protein
MLLSYGRKLFLPKDRASLGPSKVARAAKIIWGPRPQLEYAFCGHLFLSYKSEKISSIACFVSEIWLVKVYRFNNFLQKNYKLQRTDTWQFGLMCHPHQLCQIS